MIAAMRFISILLFLLGTELGLADSTLYWWQLSNSLISLSPLKIPWHRDVCQSEDMQQRMETLVAICRSRRTIATTRAISPGKKPHPLLTARRPNKYGYVLILTSVGLLAFAFSGRWYWAILQVAVALHLIAAGVKLAPKSW
jgi:hypothetical protein